MIDTNQMIHNILVEEGIDIETSKLVVEKIVNQIRKATVNGEPVMVFGLGVFDIETIPYERVVNIDGELATARGKVYQPKFFPTKEYRHYIETQGHKDKKVYKPKKKQNKKNKA